MAKTAKKTKKRTPPKPLRAARPEPRAGEPGKGTMSKAQSKAQLSKAQPSKAQPSKTEPGARPEPAAREPGTRPAFLRGLFVGAAAAMTLSMIVTMAAFAFTDPFGPAARGAAAGAQQPLAGAIIEAEAEATGRLALTVRATLTDRRYRPIANARPVVTLDMVQMPQAHRTKPVAMTPVNGSPGTYEAKAVAPMSGDFDVTVELKAPQRGEDHTRVTLPAG